MIIPKSTPLVASARGRHAELTNVTLEMRMGQQRSKPGRRNINGQLGRTHELHGSDPLFVHRQRGSQFGQREEG